MELLVIALLVGFAIEESRIAKKNADFRTLQAKQGLLMQEFQAVEQEIAKQWVMQFSNELECQR